MQSSPKYKLCLSMFLCLVLAGCPALPILIPPLIQFGASLLDSAVNNYDETHQQNMQSLLIALQQRTNPYQTQGINANPSTQIGGYPQPGDQLREYPNQQPYPPSQGYSQQNDNPYQNSQPQYEDFTQEPYNQDPNQFPQGSPYANNPNFSNQQLPPSGYPPHTQDPYLQQGEQDYPSQPGQSQYPQQGQPYPDTYGSNERASDPYQQPYAEMPEEQMGQLDMEPTTGLPISLDVLLVRKHVVNGAQTYLPINDGDILRDGRGNPQAGDKFRVMFRTNTNCYVYVIAVDGSAWAQGIFPPTSNPFANPVKAGEQYLLPQENNWFSLDQFKGIETIFVVASHERRPDIEEILATISGRERHPAEKPMAVREPAIIPDGFSGARPSTIPFAFNSSLRLQQQLLPTTYFVKTAGEDLRVTRWFRHQ